MNVTLVIILLISICIIVTYIKGKDGNRKIVVYEDWSDLGLSFFSIFFPLFITILLSNIESLSSYSYLIGFLLMIILLAKLAIYTFKSNNGNILFFIMAYITKIVLAVTLFIQIMELINPSKDEDGNSNFFSALFMFLFLSLIINNLVVNKNQGSKLNPFKWLSPRTRFTKLV